MSQGQAATRNIEVASLIDHRLKVLFGLNYAKLSFYMGPKNLLVFILMIFYIVHFHNR